MMPLLLEQSDGPNQFVKSNTQDVSDRWIELVRLESTVLVGRVTGNLRPSHAEGTHSPDVNGYEHQNPLARVAWLIGLHLPGVGLPVVPQSRQIQSRPS